MLRRAVVVPIGAYDAAITYLADTLDWLNLWHQNDAAALDDERPAAAPNRLFPHL
jgi:hypothetical protein